MMNNLLYRLSCLLLMIAAATSGAQAAVIYMDDFSGDAGTNLIGQAPDTAPGAETWVGGSGVGYKADGSHTTAFSNAYLAFTPVAGNVYTASADVTGDGGNWAAFGFVTDVASTAFYSDAGPVSSGGYGNILYHRTDVANPTNPKIYPGEDLAGGPLASLDNPTGTLGLKIVLDATDATSANWTMDFYLNNTLVQSGVGAGAGDFSNIGYVGFTNWAGTLSGTIDNFVLEDNTAVPEPGSALLCGMAGLALLLRRRRRS